MKLPVRSPKAHARRAATAGGLGMALAFAACHGDVAPACTAPADADARFDGDSSNLGDVADTQAEFRPDARDSTSDLAVTDAPDTGPFDPSIDDESLWIPVSGAVGCDLAYAKPGVVLAKRAYASCGVGCRLTDLNVPPMNGPGMYGSDTTGTAIGGHAYVTLHLYRATTPRGSTYEYFQIVRVDDEETIALMRERANVTTVSCGSGARSDSGVFAVPYFGEKHGSLLGLATGTNRAMTWGTHWRSDVAATPTDTFAWNNGLGIAGQDGSVRLYAPPDAPPVDLETSAAGVPYVVDARESLAVWALDGGARRGALRGYFGDAVVTRTLVDVPDGHLASVALSDDAMVWTVGHGSRAFEGAYDRAEIAWAPTPKTPDAPVVVTVGPSIPANGLRASRIGGDYAATFGCAPLGSADLSCVVYVVQRSTSHLWAIQRRPGSLWVRLLAVTGTELVMAEGDDVTTPDVLIRRIVRVDLASLDSWGK